MNRSLRTCARCFVPSCKNTTTNSRNKVFVHVREPLTKSWCQEANVEYKPGRRLLCCEDHLNLEEDLQNYQYHKLMNGRAILKSTAQLHLGKDLPYESSALKSPTLKSLLLLPDLSVQVQRPERLTSAENCSTINIKPTASTHPVKLEEDVLNYKRWTEYKVTRPRLKPQVPNILKKVHPKGLALLPSTSPDGSGIHAAERKRKSRRKIKNDDDDEEWKMPLEEQGKWDTECREENIHDMEQNDIDRELWKEERLRKRKQRQKINIAELHTINTEEEEVIHSVDEYTTEEVTNAEEPESDNELETTTKKSRFDIEIDYDNIDKFGEQIAFLLKRIPGQLCRELQDSIVTLVKTATNNYENITKIDVASKTKQIKTPKRKKRKQLVILKEEESTHSVRDEELEKDILNETKQASQLLETQLGTSTNLFTSRIITIPKPMTVPIELVGNLDCVKQEVLDPEESSDYVNEHYEETTEITNPLETDIKIEIEEVDLIEEAKRRADAHM